MEDAERRRRVLDALIAQQEAKARAEAERERKRIADMHAHPIWARDEERRRKREAKLAYQREVIKSTSEQELECTFRPAINPRSKELALKRSVALDTPTESRVHHLAAAAAPLPAPAFNLREENGALSSSRE